jgi:hypothetical protein
MPFEDKLVSIIKSIDGLYENNMIDSVCRDKVVDMVNSDHLSGSHFARDIIGEKKHVQPLCKSNYEK